MKRKFALALCIIFVSVLCYTALVLAVPKKTVKKYCFDISENELVVIDTFSTRSKGTLYSVHRNKQGWDIAQVLDFSEHLGSYTVRMFIQNGKWLCISCESVDVKHRKPGKVIVFEKVNNLWEFKIVLKGTHPNYGRTTALFEENVLLSHNVNSDSKGVIECYDLRESPPRVIETITLPKEHEYQEQNFFGWNFCLKNNILSVYDPGITFTPEELKKYNISKEEIGMSSIINGVKQPPVKTDVFAYVWDGVKWNYESSFYELLPHPAENVLKYDTFSVDFFNCGALYENKLMLSTGLEFYYVFEREPNGKWFFVDYFQNKRKKDNVPEETGVVVSSPVPPLTEKYAVQVSKKPLRTLQVFSTPDMSLWEPLMQIPYGNEEALRIEKSQTSSGGFGGARDQVQILNNTIATLYYLPEACNPDHPYNLSPVWAGLSIFEINSSYELEEKFRMEAFGEEGFKVVCGCPESLKDPKN